MAMTEAPQNRLTILNFFRDVRVLQVIGQIIFVLALLLVISQLAATASGVMRARNLVPSFDYLNLRAGFDIAEKPSWYTSNSLYGEALLVGVINTLRVVSMGLILTTILGVLVGIFLLSTNWLVRTISRVYVELLRNTPLLVQIFAWYFVVMYSFPPIDRALTFPPEGVWFISLRLPLYLVLYVLIHAAYLRRMPQQSPWRTGIRTGFLAAVILIEIAFFLSSRVEDWPLAFGSGNLSNPAFLAYAAVSALLIAGSFFVPAGLRLLALSAAVGQAVGGLAFYFGAMITSSLRLEVTPSIYASIRGFAFPEVMVTARFTEWMAFLGLGFILALGMWVWFGRIIENTGRLIRRELYVTVTIIGFALVGWLLVGLEPLPSTVTVTQGGDMVAMPLEEARASNLLTREELQRYSQTPLLVRTPEQNRFGRFIVGTEIGPEYMALLLALVVYTSSHIAEIVRAGIQAVPYGQIEAARALGFSQAQVLRMVVLPQALRVIIPPLGNQYLGLSKNSSLAYAIGYADLFSVSYTIMNQSGQTITGFVLLMMLYLALSLFISAVMNWLNSRFQLVTR
jgi:His/Glu/Gln/Arg/opine family amino acid ABC transporter permease subunit